MKRELGVSIYPDHSNPQEDRQYLKKRQILAIPASL